MGVSIDIDNVVKRYDDNTTVLNGLSLKVNPGEFFTLLGDLPPKVVQIES